MSTVAGYLVGQLGELSGLRLAIPATGLVIGRDPKEVDVVLEDTRVSRRHAQIMPRKNGQVFLVDLESRNGTYHNARKITTPVPLIPNDKVDFGGQGRAVFIFESASTESVTGVLKQAFGENLAPVEWNVGDTILGIYEVTGVLGEGGMGRVYKVHHRSWNMDLAVKSPLPKLFTDEKSVENFVREAETWVNLSLHPHICQCYYVRTIGAIPRIFAEYVSGGTLAEWIQQRKLTQLDQILDVAIQFAWGLHAAHEQGLVHQDVKPLNVLMTPDGIAKVSDFGLTRARTVSAESASGEHSALVSFAGGTPHYCSPEQAEALVQMQNGVPPHQRTKLGRQTDIWSWAVSVLHMFVGNVAWQSGLQAPQVLEAYNSFTGPKFAVKMPEQLAKLLHQCFQVNPNDRSKDLLYVVERLNEVYREEVGEDYCRTMPARTELLADGYNNRALSLLDLSHQDAAEKLFDEALRLDPQHLDATYNHGLVLWRSGKLSDQAAVRRVEEVRKNQQGRGIDDFLLAMIHLERADAESAVRLLERMIERGNVSADVQVALARARRFLPASARRISKFEGHTKAVTSICMDGTGRYALSGSGDETMKLWDLANGNCLHTFIGHTDGVGSVSLCADCRCALSGGDDGAKLWDVASGRCLRTLEGDAEVGSRSIRAGRGENANKVDKLKEALQRACQHELWVTAVCLTRDGRYALTGSTAVVTGDVALKLWETASGRCVRTLDGHTEWVASISLSADGRYALSGSYDKTLRLWEVGSGRCLRMFEGHTKEVRSVCLSRDGRYAVSGSEDRTVKLWEMGSGHCLRTFEGHGDNVVSVCLSQDGRHVLSGSYDKTARLWEVASGRCLRTFEGHPEAVLCVSLSHDGRRFLSGDWDGSLWLWSLAGFFEHSAPMEFSVPRSSRTASTTESRFNHQLLQAGTSLSEADAIKAANAVRSARASHGYRRHPDALELWRALYQKFPKGLLVGAWEERTFQGHKGSVRSVCLGRDGHCALSGSEDGTIKLWETASGRCLRTFEGHTSQVASVCLRGDERFALSGSLDNTLRLWDVARGNCIRTFEGHTEPVFSVSLTHDGRYALSGSGDRCVKLWEVTRGRCLRTFEGHTRGVNSVCFSGDGRYALSGDLDGNIKLWGLASGDSRRNFEFPATVQSVCMSFDSRHVLAGGCSPYIRLWDVASGRCVRTFEGHDHLVHSLCLSADGRYLCSGSWDHTLKLWEVASGCCIHTLNGHTNYVDSVCFSGDGRYALSGSHDHTVKLWVVDWELEDKQPADWDEGARQHLVNFLTLHTPCGAQLPENHNPTEEELALALTRRGKPAWTEDDFKELLYTLGCAGYGWLRPEGVRRELEKLAATWQEPPSVIVG